MRSTISLAALSVNVTSRTLLADDYAGLDRVRRAPADDARLARARAGEDHERPARGLDGRALGVVEVSQRRLRFSVRLCLNQCLRSVSHRRDNCLSLGHN